MIRILIDVNLSPAWVDVFRDDHVTAIHWSKVGDLRATDRVVLDWARNNGYVVFTHDLDFGTLLALTRATGPSVIQLRTHDVLPAAVAEIVLETLRTFESDLERGAIVTADESRGKVRILPIR